LQFERYDPAVYYPLGKGQRDKDRNLGLLAKASPDSGLFFYMSQAAKDQPDTIVAEKSLVVSGSTRWEAAKLHKGEQVDLIAKVRFPEEGEWVISAIVQNDDGSSIIPDAIYCTIGKDSGAMGWPEDYAHGRGYVFANDNVPVGVYLKSTQAPPLNTEMKLDMTFQSIKDLDQASVSVVFVKMDGYRYTYPSPIDIVVNGKQKWEGSLKRGIPEPYSCSIIFPSEGDWAICLNTRASPNDFEHTMVVLPVHVDKEKSSFDWPADHTNPALKNPVQTRTEKTSPSTPNPTSTINPK
jgi:hypothetical protein